MQLFVFSAHNLPSATYYHDRAKAVADAKKAIFELEEKKGAFVRLAAVDLSSAQLAEILNGSTKPEGSKTIIEAEYKGEDEVEAKADDADEKTERTAFKPEPRVVHRSEDAPTLPKAAQLTMRPAPLAIGLPKAEPLTRTEPLVSTTDVGAAAVAAVAAVVGGILGEQENEKKNEKKASHG